MTNIDDTTSSQEDVQRNPDVDTEIPSDVVIDLHRSAPIRETAKQIAAEVIDLYDTWSRENPFIVHVKTTQGTGKTLNVMERLHYYDGPVAVFGPRHEDTKEDANIPEFSDIYQTHFEGKDRSCLHPAYEGRHHAVHPKVSQDWCADCRYRAECSYWDAYKAFESKGAHSYTAVHNHLPLHPTILEQWPEINSLIIDESPWSTIVEWKETISLGDLTAELEAVSTLANRDPPPVNEDLLDQIQTAIEATIEVLSGDESAEATVFDHWEAVTDHCNELESQATLTRSLSEYHVEHDGPTNINTVQTMLDAVPSISDAWERAEADDLHLPTDNPPTRFWDLGTETVTVRWVDTDSLTRIARSKPIFVLATEMPTEQVQSMFDLPVVTVSDTMAPAVDVLQLDTRAAGVTQLKERGRMWDNLLELTELAIQREQNVGNTVFVAVKKALLEDVRDYLVDTAGFSHGDDFKIKNYYGLTGSNRFEDCDAVVLFGKPQLRDQDAAAKHLLTGVPTEVFQWEKREGELRDAIHRTRPARKDGIRAYILTNVPDFDDNFTGSYDSVSVPDMRVTLQRIIEDWEEADIIRDAIVSWVRAQEIPPTLTDLAHAEELHWSHRKVRTHCDELIQDGTLKSWTESGDGPGRPSTLIAVNRPQN
jgi:hypothetical protein